MISSCFGACEVPLHVCENPNEIGPSSEYYRWVARILPGTCRGLGILGLPPATASRRRGLYRAAPRSKARSNESVRAIVPPGTDRGRRRVRSTEYPLLRDTERKPAECGP